MLAFSIDYYGIFFGATQSVELFCTYFKEMGKNIDAVNTYMYIDLIKDSQYVKNYFEQQTADLLGY